MKGKPKVLETLNNLLAEELTAINQYIVHSEMCADWMYEKLHDKIEKRAIEEMGHAEKLIGRILFLEGIPVVSQLKAITIGKTVDDQFKKDLVSEHEAVNLYNAAIQLSMQEADFGTRELLESILKDEEIHVDWLEAQLDQIAQIGLQTYLVEQVD